MMEEKYYFIAYMWESAEKRVSWTPGHGVTKLHPADWLKMVYTEYSRELYKIVSYQPISKEEYDKFRNYM